MSVEVRMPSLGYDMTTGKIGKWLKKPGDRVARGEPIAEIETDKTTVEMEATSAGRLSEIVHDEGAEVEVGTVIAYLEESEP
jgi:pyruvate/2-oxoglutarate dehydrogenase complex dihydrolipoamide acyltransferase (E2) component